MGNCFTMYLNYIFLLVLAVFLNLGLRMTFMPALYSSPCTFYSRLINCCLQLLKYLSTGNLTDLCQLLSHSLPVLIPTHHWITVTLPQESSSLSFSSSFFFFLYLQRFYFHPIFPVSKIYALNVHRHPTDSTCQYKPSWTHCHFLDNTSFPFGMDSFHAPAWILTLMQQHFHNSL